MADDIKAKNRRTGIILGSIALIFFFGVMIKHYWFA